MKNNGLKKIIDLYVEGGANNPVLYDQMQRMLERKSEKEKKEGIKYLNERLNEIQGGKDDGGENYKFKLNKRLKYLAIILIILFIFGFSQWNKKINYSNEYTTIEHYCEASGCTKSGALKIKGITGKDEYYCYEHYKQLEENLKIILGY